MGSSTLALTSLRAMAAQGQQHVGLAQASGSGSSAGDRLTEGIGKHYYWCPGGPCHVSGFLGGEFNADTIVMTWVAMGLILLLALVVRGQIASPNRTPRGVQNVIEYAIDFVNGLVSDNLGMERLPAIGPLAVALFLFILTSNYLGIIPVGALSDFWHAPTSDINTTLGLALMVIIFVHISSVRVRGGAGYVRHYLEPFPALAPITIIEEITKPLTLAARLFGNIFAGEVLVLVFGTLLSGVLTVILPIPDAILGVGLGLFVGGIQAFIFTILTVVYISVGTSTEAH